ncbi:MAG: hypothetical protein MJ077_03130 [Oscillospiraceae bacterium]|nr:hypothetical protein [Oscillospiraceae bacterium]
MLTKMQALDEAQKQKKALALMAKWRRNLFILTACFLMVAVYEMTAAGNMVVGIVFAVLSTVSLIFSFIVNLSIRNGHRNVERILDSLK